MRRVLVVEDHPMVRDLFRRVLTREGFAVTLAEDAPEAIARFHEAGEPFDLLVTDQMLPGHVRGHELAWRLTAEDPHLRVLLVSGYMEPGDGLEGAIWSPRVAFLQKPATPREFIAAVRRLLL